MLRHHSDRNPRVLAGAIDRTSSPGWMFAVTMLVLTALVLSACGPAEPEQLVETAVSALPTPEPEISSPLPLADEPPVARATNATLDEIVANPTPLPARP